MVCCANVNGNNVAIVDYALAGDAVYNNVIDGDTSTSGEAAVTLEGRASALFYYKVINFPVDLLCGQTVGNGCSGD